MKQNNITPQGVTAPVNSKMPPDVQKAWDKVLSYLDALPAAKPFAKSEVETEKEKRRSKLGDLHDKYFFSKDYLSETLELLATITGHKIDMPSIAATIDKMMLEMRTLEEAVEQAFEVGGLPRPHTFSRKEHL